MNQAAPPISAPPAATPDWSPVLSLFRSGDYPAVLKACSAVLAVQPDFVPALLLFAQSQARMGQATQAIQTLASGLQRLPDETALHTALGQVQLGAGLLEDALASLARALELDPALAEAYVLKGRVFDAWHRAGDAVACYRKALSLCPDRDDVHFALGHALIEAGNFSEAHECFRVLVSTHPDDADFLHGLGLCCDWLGELDAAAEHYAAALDHSPDHIGSLNNLAGVRLACGRADEAMAAYARTAELRQDHGRPRPGPYAMLLHRVRHDAEQLRYLKANGLLQQAFHDCLAALQELEAAHAGTSGTQRIHVDAHTARRIEPVFNRLIHRAECAALEGGALNSAVDWAEQERRYLAAHPEVVYIDDFLRPEALERLRHHCLASTIWKTPRPFGYMGAMLSDGFAAPLLLQIVTELRECMPTVLGPHALTQAWAYKYDSTLSGINIHADCAAVNLNFWITPDDANLDPESGGLVVWDQPPPAAWGLLRTQNPDKTEILQYLHDTGARAVTVPHRQNRMVLFNSALFHKTDDTHFREGYENRRINVTLLYGNGLR